MILKIVSIITFILVLGSIALLNGYGHFIAIGTIASLFILPILGPKFHGVTND